MNIWHPSPGETLLARIPVTFATGAAMPVRGMRWFRDVERNDIQAELSGWPEGPTYTARSAGGAMGRGALTNLGFFLGNVLAAIVSSLAPGTQGSFGDAGSKTSDDPANEVDDFPVLWGAPGTIARSLPWQLDPARRDQQRYRTHLIVTDRRVIVVGLAHRERGEKPPVEDVVLWETPRSNIAEVVRRDFKGGDDFRILFADGSWCRLSSHWRSLAMEYLVDHPDLVPLTSLTPAQRETVEAFVAAQPPDASPPAVTRHECGCYGVEVLAPSTTTSFYGIHGESMTMDAHGAEVGISGYHLEDWSPEEVRELRSQHVPVAPSYRDSQG
ncbi:hypothetical protein OG866_18525 [Streptomyces sp. NBC_00663]|uniref:hypothetical protein n=1 Tax=Streptomyces sp. NBC_00663 TaxID=2975801 RepID=UPI002E3234B8|nr:hypothetical protein [Streptomyces sp. NBC_00663]